MHIQNENQANLWQPNIIFCKQALLSNFKSDSKDFSNLYYDLL